MSRYRSEGPESSAAYEFSSSSASSGSMSILDRLTGLSTPPVPSDRFKDDESAMRELLLASAVQCRAVWPARHPTSLFHP